jgi:ELWxxDGT repeat protein
MGSNGISGEELWKSDGTAGGTAIVKDLSPGSSNSYLWFLTNVGGTLFAYGSTDGGAGLFRSDGTSAGTFLLKSLAMEPNQFTTGQLLDVNGTAFFIANDGTTGMELWKSDGTIAGTVLVKDILPGSGDALLGSSLVAIGGTVFFAATDGVVGKELWKSDGTASGTVLVKDIFLGSGNFGSSNPAGLAAVNGRLLFRAQATLPGGIQPWTSDGTEAGTTQIAVMNPSAGGSCRAESFSPAGSNVLFSGTDGSSGVELWVMSDSPVGVTPVDRSASGSITLAQNFPNPVRDETQIAYSISTAQHVSLKVYDIAGREVRTLVDEQRSAGTHRVDMSASGLPSGAYVYRLQTGTVVEKRKMLLIR